MLVSPLKIDLDGEASRILDFVRTQVRSSGAKGVVVGVSGGVDSAVVGELCTRALGKAKVVAMLLPSKHTPKGDLDDAKSLVARWGVRVRTIKIEPIVEEFLGASDIEGGRLARANLQARIRMVLDYLVANQEGLLVAGTGDRSEEEIGFFTKYGDGGVDFQPIAHLYKTQVRAMGAHLGLPDKIVNKPASPQLWPGHTAAEELPADYDKIDLVLHYLLEEKTSVSEAALKAQVPLEVANRVLKMHERSGHKRRLPPSLL